MESSNQNIESKIEHQDLNFSPESDEVNKVKRGHVLTELLQTEQIYVTELLSIITGYKMEAQNEEMQHLLPNGMASKIDIIFGNLDEIYNFHEKVFLKDLENCISSTDLVALCFVQKAHIRDMVYKLQATTAENMQSRILEASQAVHPGMLENMQDVCRQENGGQFEHLL